MAGKRNGGKNGRRVETRGPTEGERKSKSISLWYQVSQIRPAERSGIPIVNFEFASFFIFTNVYARNTPVSVMRLFFYLFALDEFFVTEK